MKIVQIISSGPAEDPSIYALDSEGILYVHQLHTNAAFTIYDTHTQPYLAQRRYYSNQQEGQEKLTEALEHPERFTVTFLRGHTAGWVEVCKPELSVDLFDPRDPRIP